MVRIKICGNTRPQDIALEAKLGAHAVGVIHGFPQSPRNNDQQRVETLVRAAPPLVETVLVTNPAGLGLARRLGIRTVQLIAQPQEYPQLRLSNPDLKIVPVLYVSQEPPRPELLGFYSGFDYVLVDTDSRLKGGSGLTHNWKVSAMLSKVLGNIILAGGLTPENVGEAIRLVEPYAVDVSSGVESSPGIKDPERLARFIEEVKRVG